ncbi:hypothetical protein ACOMHN_021312 [Nucella lapillus]
MEARNIPSSGQLVTVEDLIVLSDWLHKSISITGRLIEHDVTTCCVKLGGSSKQEHCVPIDTRLVEPFEAKLGCVFQFTGEVTEVKLGGSDRETVVVEARVVRNCDGLDLVKYQQALRAQREYFALRQAT